MNKPHIEILGIYALPVSDELLSNQFDLLYGYEMSSENKMEAEKQIKDQLNSTVLIEVNVVNRDPNFKLSHFTQPMSEISEGSWQAPWAEAFLSSGGDSLIVDR